MKKYLVISFMTAAIYSCGGANDGDAKTDTTTMPVDTNLYKTETNHTNSAEGTRIIDSIKTDSAKPTR